MNFTDIFIRRPVLAIVVNLVIVIMGLQAVRALNVRQYPKLESASVTVRTAYVGANAELVRGFITTPLERAIAAADGIDYMESQSTQGLSTINVRLKLNFPAANALSDISARVNQVRADLPPEAEIPAINIEPSDSVTAAMYLSFSSPLLEDNQVTDYLIRKVQPRLSAIEGVQRADVLGGRTFAIRAWLKPQRMAALNISPAAVRQALGANNYLAAVGQTKGQYVQMNLTTSTDLKSVEEFKKLVVRQQGETLVRLEDIADVVLGADTYEEAVRMSGQKAVFMGVWVLPNANSLDVIGRVRDEMANVQLDLPVGMTSVIAFDSTHYIESAIHEVKHTLIETVAICRPGHLFLLGLAAHGDRAAGGNSRVTHWRRSAHGGLRLHGQSAYTACHCVVGRVGRRRRYRCRRNVERHIRAGKTARQAALLGARELVGPIISMTITLAAVYAPIGLQGGLTGALFREFAFTLAGAVFISGIVALTLSPMLASQLMSSGQHDTGLVKGINASFEFVRNLYGRWLSRSLEMRPMVYATWILFTLLIIPLYMFSPGELAPNEDQGVVFSVLDVPANATLEQIVPYAEQVLANWKKSPEFEQGFQLTTPTFGFGA